MKRLLRAFPWRAVYAGESGGEGQGGSGGEGQGGSGGEGQGGSGNQGGSSESGDDEKPKFSQKQLNKLLADDRRKHEERVKQAVQQLEEAKKAKGLTEKEREGLASKIDELQNSLLTKDEQAKKER